MLAVGVGVTGVGAGRWPPHVCRRVGVTCQLMGRVFKRRAHCTASPQCNKPHVVRSQTTAMRSQALCLAPLLQPASSRVRPPCRGKPPCLRNPSTIATSYQNNMPEPVSRQRNCRPPCLSTSRFFHSTCCARYPPVPQCRSRPMRSRESSPGRPLPWRVLALA